MRAFSREICLMITGRRSPAQGRFSRGPASVALHGPLCELMGPRLRRLTEFFGESDQKSFGAPDIAKSVHVFVLDDFTADELCAVLSEPGERLVKVVHGEHHAEVAEGVDGSGPVIGNHRRSEKPRELKTTTAVRCTHHRDLDTLLTKSGDTARPLALRHRLTFELQPERAKELNRRREVLDDYPDVVHPLNRHARRV